VSYLLLVQLPEHNLCRIRECTGEQAVIPGQQLGKSRNGGQN